MAEEKDKKSHSLKNEDKQQDEEQQDDVSLTKEQSEQIVETGSLTHSKGKHVIHCLTIVGQVEGHYILPSQNKTTKYEPVSYTHLDVYKRQAPHLWHAAARPRGGHLFHPEGARPCRHLNDLADLRAQQREDA